MHSVKRTILVTGASSGIGRAVARRLLSQGHRVIGTSRDCSRFVKHPAGFESLPLDLNETESITQLVRQLERDYPSLDTIVFAAGYGRFGSLEEFSFEQIEQLIRVNFTSQALLTRALLPMLKRQSRANLIYLGSEAALQGSRKGSIYCAGKFALRGFTQALRDECGKTGVRVTLVNPGMVQTPFFETLSFMPGDGMGQFLQAEDVADAVDYVLQAGAHLVVDEINLSPASKVVRFKDRKPSR